MAEITSNLENVAREMGINIADSVEELMQMPPSTAPEVADSSLTADQESQTQGLSPQEFTDPPQQNQGTEPEQVMYQSQFGEQTGGDEISHEEAMGFISSYLSENLGLDIDSLINGGNSNTADIDERLLPILEFVKETGRSPEDWFRYQMLNPSEMDDYSLVKMQMSLDYPELSQDEVAILLESKYKTSDYDLLDDKDRKMAELQLKIDANKARQQIDSLRSNYLTRVETTQSSYEQQDSIVDEQWLQNMVTDVEGLEGIDFELPGNKTFTFGLNPQYKDVLMSKNAELDTFFDQYVDSSGNWNHEAFNMHRAVVDNIDEIVKAVYSQGLSDGQRKVVQNVANVQTMVPQTAGPGGQQSTLAQQIESILGQQDSMMRIKF
jgi:hypothetical protein